MVMYRVTLIESERGWGQDTWTEDYSTYEEAKARVESVNAKNTAVDPPDYYIVALPTIEAVEDEFCAVMNG